MKCSYGPHQSGKKAWRSALHRCGMERLVRFTIHANSDALPKPRALCAGYKPQEGNVAAAAHRPCHQMVTRSYLAELDALIRHVGAPMSWWSYHVGLRRTAIWITSSHQVGSAGRGSHPSDRPEISDEAERMLAEVAHFYLGQAKLRGFQLSGMTEEEFTSLIWSCGESRGDRRHCRALPNTACTASAPEDRKCLFNREILDTAMPGWWLAWLPGDIAAYG